MSTLWLLIFSCFSLIFNFVNLISSEKFVNDDKNEYLLPNTSIPNHYVLRLNVELGPRYAYNGTVDIHIEVLKKVRELVLHSRNLKIDVKRSQLLKNNGTGINELVSAKGIKKNHFLVLAFNKEIVPGNYILRVVFSGNYYNYANGLFLDSYEHPNGVQKYILATHFEPVRARDMFPCYDEPNLKATFKVKVTHPKEFNAISNMPVEKTIKHSTTTTSVFQNTPKISTYLVALGVSDYGTASAEYEGKLYRIHVQKDKLNEAEFALNTTLESIRNYHSLLKVNYSLPKLDGYIVPKFGGGMENWGLIVYGSVIIVPNGPIAPQKLRSVVSLIVHEIAHQWFGNLVTLDWWDYVWLNEGFASYYAARISDMIYPEQRFMDRGVLGSLTLLQIESSSNCAESLNRPVITPEEILLKFNGISYTKGSAIVRLMQMAFPGYDEAITDYLKAFSYDNAEPSDLFEAINKRANLNGNLTVQNIMRGWSSNSGYPLLTVNITSKGNFSDVIFTQEKFIIGDKRNSSSELWYIPITFTVESDTNFDDLTIQYWMSDAHRNNIYKIQTNGGWLIINLQKAAYMRVNYDLDNWKRIIEYLKGPYYKKIHHLNRIQLIDDARNLAKAQLLPESVSLDLLSYLKQEEDEIVQEAGQMIFKEYTELLRGTKIFSKYQVFVSDILGWQRAYGVLRKPDLEELVEKAFLNYGSRYLSTSTDFDEVAERMFTDEDFARVEEHLMRNRGLNTEQFTAFLNDLSRRFKQNKVNKEEFFNNGNYDEVKKWLSSRY